MRGDKLTAVFSADDLSANAEAEVLKSLLEAAGISSLVRHVPPTFQSNGGIRLMVLASDRDEAEMVIRDAIESAT